ncbi:MAG: winged helix-turn-helix domain-containing protein, partial [Pyrinomonadaceae bacterium]
VEKDELFSSVWGDQIVEESNLTVHISQIRKALGETKNNPRFIETVPGYGYRFVGEVHNSEEDEEFIIETETLSRITIEKEEITYGNSEQADTLADSLELSELTSDHNARIAEPKIAAHVSSNSQTTNQNRLKNFALASGVILIFLSLAFGVYLSNTNKTNPPFEKIKLTRLTNNGRVAGVAISPDGKYIACVRGESEGNSLWVQQVGNASDIRLLPPVKADFLDLTFSPDGAFVYYNLFAGDKTDVELFRVPLLGGVVEKIPNVIASTTSFAPDGKRISYIQSDSAAGFNYLTIANSDGSDNKIVSKKPHPNSFEFFTPAVWSPDGKIIACLVNHFEPEASYSEIVGINPQDGSEKPLSAGRWYDVLSLEWLTDGSGLLFSASEKVSGRRQLYLLSYPDGAARRITNDLNSYGWVNATSDGKSFAALQYNTVNSISVGEIGADAKDYHEIGSEVGTLNPLVWTPEGKIVFRSDKDGVSNLWTMDASGENRRQLTVNAEVDARGMCATADGKYFVFGSWRNGKSNIWRVNSDGTNLTQMTFGEADVYPTCSPDGRWIIYQKGLHTQPMLRQVAIEGGEPVQLTDFRAKWAAVSKDGGRISYLHMADSKWRIGFIAPDGKSVSPDIDAPVNLRESTVYWSPDDRALFYIGAAGSVGNIWSLPLDGSPARPLTNFTSRWVSDFSLSPDGKSFAIVQVAETSDVVLVSGER